MQRLHNSPQVLRKLSLSAVLEFPIRLFRPAGGLLSHRGTLCIVGYAKHAMRMRIYACMCRATPTLESNCMLHALVCDTSIQHWKIIMNWKFKMTMGDGVGCCRGLTQKSTLPNFGGLFMSVLPPQTHHSRLKHQWKCPNFVFLVLGERLGAMLNAVMFSMAVCAKENAFGNLSDDLLPGHVWRTVPEGELLSLWVSMMEFQCGQAPGVSASDAFATE